MSPSPITLSAELVELLDDAALTLGELARCCRVTPEWVRAHVAAGVIEPLPGGVAAEWRFAGATLTRVRRIAHLETAFDADPQLAALTTDLMEEVARLRCRLMP
ncbi:MAG: chaperone modulator CbpM [Desulfovibrionaceae bacterium]|jgi:chaperone modulatory protein CbpM|nr:chaperone modulator CbpM [Desulfovibrionaceae bacterium]